MGTISRKPSPASRPRIVAPVTKRPGTATESDIHTRTKTNRLRVAGFFDSLDDDQLQVPSLCADWTVREVLSHLVPMAGTWRHYLRGARRSRGSLDRASAVVARVWRGSRSPR